MNKYKKLVGNSFVFAIGNFGSKVLQFALVPLYSYTLTTSQFGEVDVLTTFVSLLAPLVCLDIYDAVFRYALDKNENKLEVFNSGFIFLIFLSIVFTGLFLLCSSFLPIEKYFLTLLLLIATMLYSLISNYVRAIGLVKQYAVAGIMNTCVIGGLNIILLLLLHTGINGYLSSIIVGLLISGMYLLICLDLKKLFRLSKFSFPCLRNMIIYSAPLIPNSLAWWLNSSSDRFFILFFLGTSANGLYAMGNKIPNILNMLSNIFFQSWQMSVVEEFDKRDSKIFISNVFSTFVSLLFFSSIGILAFLKPIFKLVINNSYYTAWKLTPLILLAVIYSGISAFLGTIYTAYKNTLPVFMTTLIGAVINVFLSLIFVKLFGMNGAALANVVSFAIISYLRYRDILKLGKIEIDFKKFILNHLLFFVAVFFLIVVQSLPLFMLICFLLMFVYILLDKKLLNLILGFLKLNK